MSETVTQDQLDELWDFDDAEKSRRAFESALAEAAPGSPAAGILTTQLARAFGLQGHFAEADAVLDSIESPDDALAARVLLERGRLRSSEGEMDAAVPLFEAALLIAAAEDADFLVADAAHMLAIADGDRAEHWTARGLTTVEESNDPRVKRWAVSLHNNLGWKLVDDGHPAAGLAELELAADAARDYGTPAQQRRAQEAIDKVRDIVS